VLILAVLYITVHPMNIVLDKETKSGTFQVKNIGVLV